MANGCASQWKLTPSDLGVVVFEFKGRHFVFGAAIEEMDLFRAQSPRGVGRVDGGVPAADHDHAPADREIGGGLVAFDETERVDHARGFLAGNAEPFHGAQSQAQEDDGEVALQILDRDGAAHFRLAELHAQRAHQADLAEASEARSLYSATP